MSAAPKKARPDPVAIFRELRTAYAEGAPPAALFLLPPVRGEAEPWFAEALLEGARTSWRAQDGIDLLEVDGGSPDFVADSVEAFLSAPSLFGGERALIFARASKAFRKAKSLEETLVRAAAQPGLQLLVQVEGAGGKALPKCKAARTERFRKLYSDPPPWNPDPDRSEAAQFLGGEAKAQGMQLGRGVAGMIVRMVGGRPGPLLSSLQHFRLLGLQTVDEEDVRRVASPNAESTAFDFAEAVLSGQTKSALLHLREIEQHGMRSFEGKHLAPREAFSPLLAVLMGEWTRTDAVLRAGGADGPLEVAMEEAGVSRAKPVVARYRQRLRWADRARLSKLLEAMVDAERHLKVDGWRQAEKTLELLVMQASPFVESR